MLPLNGGVELKQNKRGETREPRGGRREERGGGASEFVLEEVWQGFLDHGDDVFIIG